MSLLGLPSFPIGDGSSLQAIFRKRAKEPEANLRKGT